MGRVGEGETTTPTSGAIIKLLASLPQTFVERCGLKMLQRQAA